MEWQLRKTPYYAQPWRKQYRWKILIMNRWAEIAQEAEVTGPNYQSACAQARELCAENKRKHRRNHWYRIEALGFVEKEVACQNT